jgi:hypothetical protein
MFRLTLIMEDGKLEATSTDGTTYTVVQSDTGPAGGRSVSHTIESMPVDDLATVITVALSGNDDGPDYDRAAAIIDGTPPNCRIIP